MEDLIDDCGNDVTRRPTVSLVVEKFDSTKIKNCPVKLASSLNILIIILLTITSSLQRDGPIIVVMSETSETKPPGQLVTKALYQFAGRLFVELNKHNSERHNLVLSPISIHEALNLVLLGTDHDSETERELLETLGYAPNATGSNQIEQFYSDYSRVMSEFKRVTEAAEEQRRELQAAGWNDHGMLPKIPHLELFNMMVTKHRQNVNGQYERDIRKYFNASIRNIDDSKPETRVKLMEELDDWCKLAELEGPIISEEDLSGHFAAILVSAIRVEAFWFSGFEEEEDKRVFHNFGLQDQPVAGKRLQQELWAKYREFNYGPTPDNKLAFRAIELPLKSGCSLVVLEPLDGFNSKTDAPNHKLNQLIEHLFSRSPNKSNRLHGQELNLNQVMAQLDDGNERLLDVSIPKFRLENKFELVDVLKEIGLMKAFHERAAEIHRMVADPVYIAKVRHLAMIDVTKDGIKAAAATAITMMGTTMLQPTPLRVAVDKPFLFVFRHERMPLFMGKLTSL